MIGPHARGSGPAIGDHVTVTHEASGSVVHGVVRCRPGTGLVVDMDGCVVELDREGWHVTTRDTEPPLGAVVVDAGGFAAQRHSTGWIYAGATGATTWALLCRNEGPLELVWERAL